MNKEYIISGVVLILFLSLIYFTSDSYTGKTKIFLECKESGSITAECEMLRPVGIHLRYGISPYLECRFQRSGDLIGMQIQTNEILDCGYQLLEPGNCKIIDKIFDSGRTHSRFIIEAECKYISRSQCLESSFCADTIR